MSDDPIYLTSVKLKDVHGIDRFEAELGTITVVTGQNASGKSSILDGIKDFFEGGRDPEANIRKEDLDGDGIFESSCEKAEAWLMFSDGVTAYRWETLTEMELNIRSGDGATLRAPKTYLDKLMPALSFDPMAFLKLPVKERAAFLLKTLPLTFTAAEMNQAFAAPVGKMKLEPLPVIEGTVDLQRFNELRQGKYDERTELNHQSRNLEGILEEFEASPHDEGTDWALERERIGKEISDLRMSIATAASDIALEAEQARGDKRKEIAGKIQLARNNVSMFLSVSERFTADAKSFAAATNVIGHEFTKMGGRPPFTSKEIVEFIEAVCAIKTFEHELIDWLERIDKGEADSIANETSERSRQVAALSVELGTASSNAEQQTRAAGVKAAIKRTRKELEGVIVKVSRLDAILKAMDRLKLERLKQLPIEGLDIKVDAKGKPAITVGGIPMDSLNSQKQLYVAIQAVKQSAGRLPLIISEASELDRTHLIELAEACQEAGIQLIVAMRVDKAPLRVMNLEQYMAMAAA